MDINENIFNSEIKNEKEKKKFEYLNDVIENYKIIKDKKISM